MLAKLRIGGHVTFQVHCLKLAIDLDDIKANLRISCKHHYVSIMVFLNSLHETSLIFDVKIKYRSITEAPRYKAKLTTIIEFSSHAHSSGCLPYRMYTSAHILQLSNHTSGKTIVFKYIRDCD